MLWLSTEKVITQTQHNSKKIKRVPQTAILKTESAAVGIRFWFYMTQTEICDERCKDIIRRDSFLSAAAGGFINSLRSKS